MYAIRIEYTKVNSKRNHRTLCNTERSEQSGILCDVDASSLNLLQKMFSFIQDLLYIVGKLPSLQFANLV